MAGKYESESSKSNYAHALSFYKEYLADTGNFSKALEEEDGRFYIGEQWTPAALVKVKRWVESTNMRGEEGYRTSNTLIGLFSSLRKTMRYAYKLNLISTPVSNVLLSEGVRETDVRAAYSDEEVQDILDVVAPMARFSKSLLEPYEPTGLGKDPRYVDREGVPCGQSLEGEGWECKENIVWYFENVMDCKAVPGTKEYKERHRPFFNAATNKHNGLNQFYRDIGVSSLIGTNVILPLLVELIAETGLNIESVLSLKRDCFQEEHPLTGQPYLRYSKERSGGEKELHTSLFNMLNADRLRPEQSQVIRETIETILALTEPLVEEAKPEYKDYLFIYQSRGSRYFGQVRRVNGGVIRTWADNLVEEHGLTNENGESLNLRLSRFRPTYITNAVREGHDVFKVQAIAGHKNLHTFLRYVDSHNVAPDFQREMTEALENIKTNMNEQKENPSPVATERDAEPGEFIFKGPICSCKNPYDPPQKVRNSPYYSEGDACTYWNQCLFCENVVITENSLPKLIAYRRQIETALERHLDDIPHMGELYRRAASVIDAILASGTFAEDETARAAELAENLSTEALDAFVYQGIAE